MVTQCKGNSEGISALGNKNTDWAHLGICDRTGLLFSGNKYLRSFRPCKGRKSRVETHLFIYCKRLKTYLIVSVKSDEIVQ